MMDKTGGRIAIVDPVGRKAGMDRYDLALACCLREAGYEVSIFSNFTPSPESAGGEFFPATRGWISYLRSRTGLRRSLAACRKAGVRHVVFHFFKGGLASRRAVRLARRFGLHAVLIVHEVRRADRRGRAFFRKAILRSPGLTLVVHNRSTLRDLQALAGEAAAKNTFIAPHVAFTGTVKAAAAAKESLLPKPEPGHKYFLFFGQLKRSKGLEVLLRALQPMDAACGLVIAGPERDVALRRYEPWLRPLRDSGRLHLIARHIGDTERDALFRSAAAVVLPYHHGYQSGVMIAAMSAGAPVVASDIASHREAIRHGENGLLFCAGDADALRKVLQDVASGKSSREALARGALETLRREHGCEAVNAAYAAVLRP